MSNYGAASPLVMAGFIELRAELQRQLAEQTTEEKTDDRTKTDTGPGCDLAPDQGCSSRRRSNL